ncbi:MAG: sulfatase [Pricia sp.]|nr:sulfatase [Pricia sp.]
MTFTEFRRKIWSLAGVLFTLLSACHTHKKTDVVPATQKPNILVIAVDDLNDWIGVLGGHPQVKTPNIDRLAERGMLFSNAQCQAPVCNPSRASIMTSLYPSTSGIYFLNPDISESPVARNNVVMPKRFEVEGYTVFGAGKLFHNARGINEQHVPNYAGQFGGFGPIPKNKLSNYPGHPLWDWGAFPEHDSLMPDDKIAVWAETRLQEQQKQPFWMGVGFYRPHVPQFAPQKWFDMYPLESIQLPQTITADLKDISSYGVDLTRLKHVSPNHEWVTENEAWKPLVQSYLACVSFVDHQVGRVLSALERSDYADNTYVVLFSDHGFHIGEKERHAKRSLWEDGARVPLIVMGPGIPEGEVCNKPVQLLDIYPTLLELSQLEADPNHEGNSLVPLLENSKYDWPHYARTSFGPGNYAIVSERYRFIQYNDGSEEFYDHATDPHEWDNQIDNPDYTALVTLHRKQIPQQRYEILGDGSTGHLSFEASEVNRKTTEK